jgi:hypothetical protein
MRFKSLKSFNLGKPKERPEKDQGGAKDATAMQIAEMEEKLSGRAKDLEAAVQQIQGLSDKNIDISGGEDVPVRPHGPIGELTVESEEKTPDKDKSADTSELPGENGEEIKIVEVKTEAAAELKEEKEKKEEKAEDDSESLSKLFSQDEEEENPLANLINSLPDVTAQELLDDLNEIKGIISEWQQS